MKAMAHDVEDRYINATALLRDLEELRNNPDATFVSVPESPEMERRTGLYVRSAGKDTGGGAEVEEPAIVERKEVRWGNSGMARAEENDFEEETSVRGRISTIAVVACSLVAILAIIIFMILLTQKDSAMTALPTDDTVLLQQMPETSGTSAAEMPMQVTTTAARIPAEGSVDSSSQMVQTTSATSFPLAVEMKNLVNLTRQEAEQILASQGFTNIHWVQQESWLPAGTVIAQSVEPSTLANLNAPLYVTCAAGAITMNCTFDMPFSMESYYLTIMLDGRPVVLEQQMEPVHATASFQLTGRGKQTCELYVNGQLYYSVMVDFDAYAAK